MNEFFLKIINMSISAGWLVLAVLVLRLLLKKAPKWVNVLLWGLVAVRLVFPFSIESIFSLIPSAETVPMDIEMAAAPAIDSGISTINRVVNPVISASFTPNPVASANPLQIWIPVAAVFWLLGVAVMLLYTAVSYGRLLHRVRTAVRYRDNIFQSEQVASPFVLGVFRPRIYLPFHLDEQALTHILAHEQAHIRRKDHWWKPLGFLLLTVHWFNPLLWLAYVLLCRDMELACDERVIRDLDNGHRADYTQALVTCSVKRRMVAACPLAFGEVGVKERVKSVMHYRKPAFWVIVAAVLVCVVTALCFLTNPKVTVKSRLVPGSAWRCEEIPLSFSMNDSFVLNGTFYRGEEAEPVSIGYRFAGFYNAVFDLYAGDWVQVQTSGDEPLLSGILSAEKRTLVLDVKTDNLGIDEDRLVFTRVDQLRQPNRVIGYSALYTEDLIDRAMDIAQREFEKQFPGCVLTELRYDEEIENRVYFSEQIAAYWDQGEKLIPVIVTYQTANRSFDSRTFYLVRTEVSWEFVSSEPYKKRIALNDIIILSQYGYDLHWSDFEDYPYTETGSGLYIRVYEINEMYDLWIGGTDTDSDPMYIYLALAEDPETRIDIRDGGVTEFLEQNNKSDTDSNNNDLQLQLMLPKHKFEAGEPIECKAVLTYVGEEDTVTIFYNNPIVIFTLDGGEYFHGDRYGWAVHDVNNAPAAARILKKGEPMEIPFQKQQHWFTGLLDDTEKAFWEDYKASPELTLEPGNYEIIAHFAYSLKRVTAHGPFEKIDVSETIIVE